MNATFLGVGQNILLTPPTYFKVVTTPPHPTPRIYAPVSYSQLLANRCLVTHQLQVLFSFVSLPVWMFHCPHISHILYAPFDLGLLSWHTQLKGYIKELNISIYFCPSLHGVLFPMFCLPVEGEFQILVF